MTGPATPPTEADLLAHAGFVRVLARTLVAGEAEADDLSQDAYLAALRSPPAESTNLKGWFARVLRNLARMRHRTGQRRIAREAAAARSEGGPAADETAARLEIQRRLVDAVTSLDEPFRTTVVLRYFDGLRPVEIARRQGIPANTVHSRISRALDRLRDKLDREQGGDRSAWRAALLPLAGLAATGTARAATGASAALLTGGIAVSTKLKVGLVAAVLAVSAVAVWQGVTPEAQGERAPVEENGRTPPLTRASTAAGGADQPAAGPGSEPVSDAPPPAAAEPEQPAVDRETWRVIVTVLDHTGAVAPGAHVAFSNEAHFRSPRGALEAHIKALDRVMERATTSPEDRRKMERQRADAERRIAKIDRQTVRFEGVADGNGWCALDVPGPGGLHAESYGASGSAVMPQPPWEGDHEVTIQLHAPDRFGPMAPWGEFTSGPRGMFGGRGGHRNLKSNGGGKTTQVAADLGLYWLARHQSPDGGWTAGGGVSDPAVTGLALLAFLGGGQTHAHGNYKKTVGEGLAYLLAFQDGSGGIGAGGPRETVNQAIATQALAEAWALTGRRKLGDGAQRATDFLVATVGESTPEEAVWAAWALIMARTGKLDVPETALDWARTRLAEVLEKAGRHDPALVGGALFGRGLLDPAFAGTKEQQRGIKLLRYSLPKRGDRADFPAWHFATLAVFLEGGKSWEKWNVGVKKTIPVLQQKDGDDAGSWEPLGPQADVLGRAGVTALAVSTMQVYYRYALPAK